MGLDTTFFAKQTTSVNRFFTAALYWKVFAFRLLMSNLIVFCAALTAALAGVDLAQLSGTQKLIVLASLITAVAKNSESMIDKTFSQLASSPDNPMLPPAVQQTTDAPTPKTI